MDEAHEVAVRFASRVLPHAMAKLDRLRPDDVKMAHYTTADNARLILQNRSLWLRNAAMMNDFSEVQHGTACLNQSLATSVGDRFKAALNQHHLGLFDEVYDRLSQVIGFTRHQTYLSSVSAHSASDRVGRLSMWRAYGGPTSGIALIFNSDIFESNYGPMLQTFSSPVLYGGPNEFLQEFETVTKNMEGSAEAMRVLNREFVSDMIFRGLLFAILSTKHRAFQEEQEWRIIHTPFLNSSDYVTKSVQSIRGVPQLIYQLPLENRDGFNMPMLDLRNLLHRVIIGPCAYPNQVFEAFREILGRLGIANVDSRIALADIPLRQIG